MVFRYELGIGNQNIGVGFLMGICELDGLDDEQLDKLTSDFDKHLPIPPNSIYIDKQSKSYFTQKGIKKFKKSIENLKNEYIRQGFDVYKNNLSQYNPNDVLYEDKYQVVLKIS